MQSIKTILTLFLVVDNAFSPVQLIVSNKVSFLDHIVLHLAGSCVSVSVILFCLHTSECCSRNIAIVVMCLVCLSTLFSPSLPPR